MRAPGSQRTPLRLPIAAAYFLLGLAWLITNPPGAAPDETSHYIRMIGISQGDFLGRDVALDTPRGAYTGVGLERINHEAGEFDLPGHAPPPNDCNIRNAARPYDCEPSPITDSPQTWTSFHARTLPGSYLLPAAASLLADSTNAKLYLGRLGFLAQNVGLVVIAAVAIRPIARVRERLGVMPVVLATTPLVCFLSGQLAPSGTEWAVTISLAAALTRTLYEWSPGWWIASALLSVAAFWTRDSAFLIVPLVILGVAAAQRHRVRGLWRGLGARSALAGAAIAAAGALTAAAWRIRWQYPVVRPELSVSELERGLRSLRVLTIDGVAHVGGSEVDPGIGVALMWLALGVVVVWTLARRSPAWAVGASVVAVIWAVYNVWVTASLAAVGYSNQPRFSSALVGASAMALIVFVRGRSSDDRDRWTLVAIATVTASIHAFTLWFNYYRHAYGTEVSLFSGAAPAWEPPIGRVLSAVLVCVACLAAGTAVWPPKRGLDPVSLPDTANTTAVDLDAE